MTTKRGRMSKYEIQFITDNTHNMDYLALAKALNRRPDSVRAYMEDKLGLVISLAMDTSPVSLKAVQYDIETEEFWPIILKQFDDEELIIFRYQWNKIYKQFGGDVLPTEELQIIDIIKLEVLMNRNLKEQRDSKTGIEELEHEILITKEQEPVDKMWLASLQQQLGFFRTAQTTMGKDYRELLDRKEKQFKAIKGTRNQRLDRIENSNESFLQWMSEIIDNPQRRKQLGIRMEKMRLAVLDEKIRLAAYHKYEDGNVDQPLLSHETVKEDNGRVNVWDAK